MSFKELKVDQQLTIIINTLKIAREHKLEAEVVWSIIQDCTETPDADFRDTCWNALGEWDCLENDSIV